MTAERAYFVDSVPTLDAITIYDRYFGGEKVNDIARDFDVHPSRIIDIANTCRAIAETLADFDAKVSDASE